MAEIGKVLIITTGGTITEVREHGKMVAKGSSEIILRKRCETYPQLAKLMSLCTVVEFGNIDSSCATPSNWLEIANKIRDGLNTNEYRGVVVTHGTDTLSYAAACLSFLLYSLRHPVVVTGSQISLTDVSNDAVENLFVAINVALNWNTDVPVGFEGSILKIPSIPEVVVAFHGNIYLGNRIRKLSTEAVDAFGSPNAPPIGTRVATADGFNFDVPLIDKIWKKRKRDIDDGRHFLCYNMMTKGVKVLRIFPGIEFEDVLGLTCDFNVDKVKQYRTAIKEENGSDADTIMRLSCVAGSAFQPRISGLVLEGYGAGNIPTDIGILGLLSSLLQKNVVIVAVTQCEKGRVSTAYDVNIKSMLPETVLCFDITTEAAFAKLSVLLGIPPESLKESPMTPDENRAARARKKMEKAHRGEQTKSKAAVARYLTTQ